MKRFFCLLTVCAAVLVFAAENPKYIFLFIGDGMSFPQRMIADEFSRKSGHGQLVLNTFPCHATTRTCSASSLVTDSAAAATAIACGVKTANGKLGVDPENKPVESVAEVAAKHGKKVGIVTTVTINHATPGGFYAHQSHRGKGYEIGLDLIKSNFDFFGGGGLGVKFADNKKSPEYRGNIYDLAAKAGYKVISTKAELEALRPGCGKVFARGSEEKLPYELDNDGTTATLAEYTAKAIELLEDSPKGFFMMVEGGSIDWCGHANEAACNLREVLGLDMAVRVAVKFAEKHPDETLIIVTGDHETGGMSMGFAGTGYALYVERLANQKRSTDYFLKAARKRRAEMREAANDPKLKLPLEEMQKLLAENYGFKFEGDVKQDPMVLTADEIERLKEANAATINKLSQAARKIMSGKAGVGWTSGSHTALPVLTTSYGKGAENFTGFIDNTDIAKRLKELVK